MFQSAEEIVKALAASLGGDVYDENGNQKTEWSFRTSKNHEMITEDLGNGVTAVRSTIPPPLAGQHPLDKNFRYSVFPDELEVQGSTLSIYCFYKVKYAEMTSTRKNLDGTKSTYGWNKKMGLNNGLPFVVTINVIPIGTDVYSVEADFHMRENLGSCQFKFENDGVGFLNVYASDLVSRWLRDCVREISTQIHKRVLYLLEPDDAEDDDYKKGFLYTYARF